MNTPIADFVKGYVKQNMVRTHMPGHKGVNVIGCEGYDITEVFGADSLYEAKGIIAESEKNATKLFGTAKTFYSTEGSSQCIRAMLFLAMQNKETGKKPVIVATRNAHKSFLYAVAMLDLEVVWLWPENEQDSLCSCHISAKALQDTLNRIESPPIAVYITSPDYLGGQLDVQSIADICHRNETILAVDNAHGSYLRFLEPSQHPIDLGADLCCDSAHKTLPVLTGGAYLHIGKNAPQGFVERARQALAIFGSTSPSYLILMSLDLCNAYLADTFKDELIHTITQVNQLKQKLEHNGWKVMDGEPLKMTVCMPSGIHGEEIVKRLREHRIECEYYDHDYIVCMFTPQNFSRNFTDIKIAFGENHIPYMEEQPVWRLKCKTAVSIREAMFAKQKTVSTNLSLGCVCGTPTVSCPPAIPIVVSGEVIDEEAVKAFKYYGIDKVDIVAERLKN